MHETPGSQADLQREHLSQLRKESHDIYNRLHSIAEDSAFVDQVHQTYPEIPLLPNLRCGAWYTDPKITTEGSAAYFKSTDGHFGNWSFNLRRPNLHLLRLLSAGNGLILVDSTRAGKRIPDALSKTVPIWCTVINRAVHRKFPELTWKESDLSFYTPPGVVSTQEHHQISTRLDAWVDALSTSSYDLPRLPHPLRPFWLTPSASTFPSISGSFIPILCVSASRQVLEGQERRAAGFVYIQGSGDDHDLWGEGLTPKIFWAHRDEILGTPRAELQGLINSLTFQDFRDRRLSHFVQQSLGVCGPSAVTKVGGGIMLWSLGDMPLVLPSTFPDTLGSEVAYLLILTDRNDQYARQRGDMDKYTPSAMCLQTTEGKKGQIHFLQNVLPQAMTFIATHLGDDKHVCVCCDNGTDLSIGVALAAIQTFFDDNGQYVGNAEQKISRNTIDKQSIRTRLQWIISSHPAANPSRTTLKRVNEFLLTPSSFRPIRVAPPLTQQGSNTSSTAVLLAQGPCCTQAV